MIFSCTVSRADYLTRVGRGNEPHRPGDTMARIHIELTHWTVCEDTHSRSVWVEGRRIGSVVVENGTATVIVRDAVIDKATVKPFPWTMNASVVFDRRVKKLVREHVFKPVVPDWRPAETLPEDYYAL